MAAVAPFVRGRLPSYGPLSPPIGGGGHPTETVADAFPRVLAGVLACLATAAADHQNRALNVPLKDDDPEIYHLIQEEKKRQFRGLELIASEVRPRER